MDAIMQWGISLVLALQNIGGLGSVMKFFTFLGQEEFFLFVMPVVYWCVDAGLGAIGCRAGDLECLQAALEARLSPAPPVLD
jgi:hypothetical protein